jgi:hypothetical protein
LDSEWRCYENDWEADPKTKNMKIVKLLLPGRFEDAFVYMGRIVALTEQRTIQFWDYDKIVSSVAETNPGCNPAPALAFSRNDWLSSSVLSAIMANTEIADSIASAFDKFPQPFLEISGHEFCISEDDLAIPARVLLDMNIYLSRIYIGTDIGLYHVDGDWENGSTVLNTPRKRTEARCLRTTVGYGAVNASCGSEGLFSAEDDFGWTGRRNSFRKVATESFRCGWLHFDLMNYSSEALPLLLKSEYETTSRGERKPEHEGRVVTAIAKESVDLSYLFDLIRHEYQVETNSIQYMYNSNSVLFIHTFDGHFYSLGVATRKGDRPRLTFRRTYKGAQTRILSANWTSVGLVLETDHRVLLFAHNEWFPIHESEVISIRTFPRSRRYRNTVIMTTEEGVLIAGVFDNAPPLESRTRAEQDPQ